MLAYNDKSVAVLNVYIRRSKGSMYRACARFVGGAAFNRNVWQKPEEIVLCCKQNVV